MKSGRCCKKNTKLLSITVSVSIPLKSGRCCKSLRRWFRRLSIVSIPLKSGRCCKRYKTANKGTNTVSIPLKSGRCCKTTGWSETPFGKVSIPLKSGRCCKVMMAFLVATRLSQSLWSQGGAASTKCNEIPGVELSQSLWSQGGAARRATTQQQPTRGLNPFEVREVLQVRVQDNAEKVLSQSLWSQGGAARSLWLNWLTNRVSIPLKSGRCCKCQGQSKG